MSNSYDYKKLDELPKDKKRISLVQKDDTVYQALLMVKRFFFGWRVVADLMEPVRKVDKEIEECKLKLQGLQDKRDKVWKQAVLIINSVGNTYEGRPYKLGKGDLVTIEKPFSADSKSGKKKEVEYVELVGTPRPQSNNQNQNRKGNGNNNQNNH